MAFYISGPKLLFETTEISTHPNSTQQESNYIYLYTTKFGTSIKIRLNRKFESTEFETVRVNCILLLKKKKKNMPVDYKYILFNIKNDKLSIFCILTHSYGKHRKSQSMKDLWTLLICHLFSLMS